MIRSLALVFVASGLIVSLTSCYDDFKGDFNRLGFESNLTVGSGSWSPEYPIASKTRAFISAQSLLTGEPREDSPHVSGRVTGRGIQSEWLLEEDRVAGIEAEMENNIADPMTVAVHAVQPHTLSFTATGRAKGTVFYTGETSDRFDVEFAPAVSADLVDWGAEVGAETADVALVPGVEIEFSPELVDRRGRRLGYDQRLLEVSASGGISVERHHDFLDDDVINLRVTGNGVTGQDGRVTLRYSGDELATVQFLLADPEEVTELTLHGSVIGFRWDDPRTEFLEESTFVCVGAAAWIDEDTRLRGADVEWEWTGGWKDVSADEPPWDVLCLEAPAGSPAPEIHARLGELYAALAPGELTRRSD